MSNSDTLEFRLLDTDLTTVLGILPADDPTLFLQLNEPGSGALKVPLDSSIANSISSGQFAIAYYRGAARGGFFIENINKNFAGSSEGGDKMITISGRGGLALLDDAIVWDDGTSSSVRTFSDKTMGYVMKTLIDEAQTRGGLVALAYDFTATLDSDSVAWTDENTWDLTVGKSLLDVLRDFADNGIDWDISLAAGTFTLHAYKGNLGSDLSESVYFRIGQNCEEVSETEHGGEIKNALKVKYKGGFAQVTDSTSITNRRRRETLANQEAAGSSQAAITFGQAELVFSKDPEETKELRVTDQEGTRVFVDYGLGDTIVLDKEGTEEDFRIRALGLSWKENQFASIVCDLNSSHKENEIRMSQEIANLRELWTRLDDADLPLAQFWAALGNPNTDQVTSILATVIDSDDLYVGGQFTRIGGVEANNIAKLDMTTGRWSKLGVGVTGVVLSIGIIGSDVYAGLGSGGGGEDYIQKWNGATWSDLGLGLGGFSAGCLGIAISGTNVYCVGTFDEAGGALAENIAIWDSLGSSWSTLGAGLTSAGAHSARSISIDGSNVYVTGDFDNAGGNPAQDVALWNGSSWSALGSGLTGGHGDATEIINSELYVGGSFTAAGGVANTNYIAKWTGVAWVSLSGGAGPNLAIYALEASATDLYLGGLFTTVDGITMSRIAKWNGSNYQILGDGSDGGIGSASVRAIAIYELNVIMGGYFTGAGNIEAEKLAIYLTTVRDVLDFLGIASSSIGPGGPEQSVQFNDGGLFGGIISFLLDKATDILHVSSDGKIAMDVADPVSPLEIAGNILTSSLKIDYMELQSKPGDEEILFGRNVFYNDDESDWVARVTGSGESIRMWDGYISLNTFGSEAAGSVTSEFTRLLLKHNGDVGLGSSAISGILNNLANAIISINGGRVGINIGNAAIPGQFSVAGNSFFGDNGNTHYATFADDGELTFFGTARVLIQADIDLTLIKLPGVNNPAETTEANFRVLDFDKSTDESIYVEWHVPHDYADAGLIHMHLHFFADTQPGSDQSVRWGLEYKKISAGDVFDFSGTSTATVGAVVASADAAKTFYESGAIALTTAGFVSGDHLLFRFFRDADGTSGTDDLDQDARLVRIHIEYLSDKLGEAT